MMRLQERCRNATRAYTRCFTKMDREGRDVLVAVAKVVYAVSPRGEVSLADSPPHGLGPPRMVDVRHDNPSSSARYPSDFVDHKPGTDVLLVGTAHGPEVKLVVLSPADSGRGIAIDKKVRVHGPRVWVDGPRGLVPGPAASLVPTQLRYENVSSGEPAAGAPAPLLDDAFAPLPRDAPSRAGGAPAPTTANGASTVRRFARVISICGTTTARPTISGARRRCSAMSSSRSAAC